MFDLNSRPASRTKAIGAGAGVLAVVALVYSLFSMHSGLEKRMANLDAEIRAVRDQNTANVSQLTSGLKSITEKMGTNSEGLVEARALAEQLRHEHDSTSQRLRRELAAKADTNALSKIRTEASAKLAQLEQNATSKIGAVSGEVQTVRADLDQTRSQLSSSVREISDQIARNSAEVADLRKRGERDYFEFEVPKGKQSERVADVRIQLKKTDTKKQKFDLVIFADDRQLEEKGRLANTPVQFLVGHDRLRYELVVNYVDKDRVRGYISTPKDRVLAAERPSFRRAQQ